MKLTLWHKPNCSTSRKVLGMLREAGFEPEIFDYIATPPTRAQLLAVLKLLKLSPRGLLRRANTPFDDLGLADEKWSDEQLVDFMLQFPVLIERPILVAGRRAVVARPPEKIFELLPAAG